MLSRKKILGHSWDRREDALELQIKKISENITVTKRAILSHLGSLYDPLGMISFTMVQGRQIAERLKSWLRWVRQLKSMKVPRSLIKNCMKVNSVRIRQFADELWPVSL